MLRAKTVGKRYLPGCEDDVLFLIVFALSNRGAESKICEKQDICPTSNLKPVARDQVCGEEKAQGEQIVRSYTKTLKLKFIVYVVWE